MRGGHRYRARANRIDGGEFNRLTEWTIFKRFITLVALWLYDDNRKAFNRCQNVQLFIRSKSVSVLNIAIFTFFANVQTNQTALKITINLSIDVKL